MGDTDALFPAQQPAQGHTWKPSVDGDVPLSSPGGDAAEGTMLIPDARTVR